MKILELIRLEETSEGTFGVLKIDKVAFCCTLEPRDLLNKSNVSSIPAQQYTISKIDSPKFGKTYIVDDVPNRSNILFHKGNTVGNTEGCILLGSSFGKLGMNRAILNSGSTFQFFRDKMGDEDKAHLTIREVY